MVFNTRMEGNSSVSMLDLPLEIHYKIANTLIHFPTKPSQQHKNLTAALSSSHASTKQSKRILPNSSQDQAEFLFNLSLSSKLLWERLSCGGICDNVWKKVCLKSWPHDHIIREFYDTYKREQENLKLEQIMNKDNENPMTPYGFWRKIYCQFLQWEFENCGGVSKFRERGLDAALKSLLSLQDSLFAFTPSHKIICLPKSGKITVTPFKREHGEYAEIQAHIGHITCIAANHGLLVTGGQDDAVRLWDLKGKQVGLLYCTGMGYPSQVQVDSDKIVVGDVNGVVRVFDGLKFQVKRILFGLSSKITHLKTNKNYIVASDVESNLMIWDIAHSTVKLKTNCEAKITSMVLIEQILAIGMHTGQCVIYSQSNWKKITSFHSPSCHSPISHIQHKSGFTVAATPYGQIFVHSLENCSSALEQTGRAPQSNSIIQNENNDKNLLIHHRHRFGTTKYLEIQNSFYSSKENSQLSIFIIGDYGSGEMPLL